MHFKIEDLQEEIQRISKVSEELIARVEPLGGGEPHVVNVEGVGDHEVRPAVLRVPVREVIVVGVRVVQESPLLHDEPGGSVPGQLVTLVKTTSKIEARMGGGGGGVRPKNSKFPRSTLYKKSLSG